MCCRVGSVAAIRGGVRPLARNTNAILYTATFMYDGTTSTAIVHVASPAEPTVLLHPAEVDACGIQQIGGLEQGVPHHRLVLVEP